MSQSKIEGEAMPRTCHDVLPGETVSPPVSVLTKHQRRKFGPKHLDYYGEKAVIVADVRYDDECGNGHNSFSITGEVRSLDMRKRDRTLTCGCIHEEIAKAFPELAPLIKWHLTSSDGPMHYAANVTFLAGDRDCWGKLKGEPKSFGRVLRWKGFPLSWRGRSHTGQPFLKWCEENGAEYVATQEIIAIEHENKPGETYKFGPKFTIGNYPAARWHECPFDEEDEAQEFLEACRTHGFKIDREPTSWGEGKARELDAARRAAIWPEATDAELSLPKAELEALLAARLPALMAEFRAAVESLGFTY